MSNGLTVRVGGLLVHAGDVFTIPVWVDFSLPGSIELGSLQFVVKYAKTRLEFLSHSFVDADGNLSSPFQGAVNPIVSGQIRVGLFTVREFIRNGPVVWLEFRVKPPVGNTVLSVTMEAAGDKSGAPVPASVGNVTVMVR